MKFGRGQDRLCYDVFGVQSVRSYRTCQKIVRDFCNGGNGKGEEFGCLYQPNFLVLYDEL